LQFRLPVRSLQRQSQSSQHVGVAAAAAGPRRLILGVSGAHCAVGHVENNCAGARHELILVVIR